MSFFALASNNGQYLATTLLKIRLTSLQLGLVSEVILVKFLLLLLGGLQRLDLATCGIIMLACESFSPESACNAAPSLP